MSGHSKWAQIKRQKGVADAKRGQTFTKLASAITLAVKQGGGSPDPSQNFRLRLVIESAKAANMPKENIERAIKRASGREGAEVQEIIYEGFAPHGVSLIIEAVTDNNLRTTSEIKSFFNKEGGTFAQPGAVSYQFKQVGEIVIPENNNFDDVFSKAVDAGAEDIVEDQGGEIVVYTPVDKLISVKNALSEAGLEPRSIGIIRKPINTVVLQDEEIEKVMTFIDKLEEKEDVQKIYSNLEL